MSRRTNALGGNASMYQYSDMKKSKALAPSAGALAAISDRAEPLSHVLKALGHPLRLRIVALLCEGDEHVGAIATRLGASQAMVSQQLGVLRMNRLVESRRESGLAVYSISEPRLHELVGCLQGCQRG
jgi:ArsR family transcriptional regulator